MLDYIQIVLESSQRSGEPKNAENAETHTSLGSLDALAPRHMKGHTHFLLAPK